MKIRRGFSITEEPFYSDPFGASSLAPFLTLQSHIVIEPLRHMLQIVERACFNPSCAVVWLAKHQQEGREINALGYCCCLDD